MIYIFSNFFRYCLF